MYIYTKILIWQLCCVLLALCQGVPKHPVPPYSGDPCAKFNGVAFEKLPEWFVNDWYDQRCFDCCPPNGEYIRYELLDDGKEDCSTGRDEWIFTDYKSHMARGDFGRKIVMALLSPKCLPKEKDVAVAISKMANVLMNEKMIITDTIAPLSTTKRTTS